MVEEGNISEQCTTDLFHPLDDFLGFVLAAFTTHMWNHEATQVHTQKEAKKRSLCKSLLMETSEFDWSDRQAFTNTFPNTGKMLFRSEYGVETTERPVT